MSNSESYRKEICRISLGVEERTDESVKLVLKAFEDGFCMRGEAFFSMSELENFLFNLRKFPIAEYNSPSLSGGYFDDMGDRILMENLHISVSPFNKYGLLVLKVKAFTPHPSYSDKNIGFGGRCTYFLSYEDLKKFADGFQRLISKNCSLFEFEEFEYV